MSKIILLLTIFTLSGAFTPFLVIPRGVVFDSKSTLRSTMPFEESAFDTFSRASQCIEGACSLEESENLLNEVLSVQAHCVASDDSKSPGICKDAILTSELIVGLRNQISAYSDALRDERNFWVKRADREFQNLAAFSFDDATGALSSTKAMGSPIGLEYMVSFLFVVTIVNAQLAGLVSDTVPFTMDEWAWSLRDGYFFDMLKHGGLNAEVGDGLTPFTFQEWGWAARDGYFFDMFKHGGAGF